MHLYREGQRQRSRILYVFRTPGGVRVGRDALEPDVLRQIELQYPDIAFNWQTVRETQQIIETAAEPRRRRPKREEESAAAQPVAAPAPAAVPAPPRAPVPAAIEGATPDEQIGFLSHWHPIVRDRILHRTSDPSRQAALLSLAERLNPATWTDADQITTGLQQAAEALERLSRVFARRRRRTKRREGEARPSGGAGSPVPES